MDAVIEKAAQLRRWTTWPRFGNASGTGVKGYCRSRAAVPA